jgi:L-ascorbate metabolism protein UlaG (beta-lactamase superfamily)
VVGLAVGPGEADGLAVGPEMPHAARITHKTATKAEWATLERWDFWRARTDLVPATGIRGEVIGGIVAWSSRRGRGPGGTSFVRVAFLIGWIAVRERSPSRVQIGPNPLGSILPPSERGADWAGASLFSLCQGFRLSRLGRTQAGLPRSARQASDPGCSALCQNRTMELIWYGRTCIRLRGKDAVVVADPYQAVVGPTGRGITGEIVTYSHPDDKPLPKAKGVRSRDGTTLLPSSLEDAFVLDGPGEYEVKDVLVTGVRTYRDDAKGADRGKQVAFLVELDGLHTIHLGEIGHLLTEEKLADIGPVDIACLPIGGSLSPTKAAELVSQLDPRIVLAMPLDEESSETREAVAKFFHEMGGDPTPQPKLSITISGLPLETTAVLLESRGKT